MFRVSLKRLSASGILAQGDHSQGILDATGRRRCTRFRYYIAHAAIAALAKDGKMTGKDVARAIKQYKIDPEKANPVGV